jgi:serine/threonine protein kinase
MMQIIDGSHGGPRTLHSFSSSVRHAVATGGNRAAPLTSLTPCFASSNVWHATAHPPHSSLLHTGFSSGAGASTACPHIVSFYGSLMLGGHTAVLALEYVGGGSLQCWIDRAAPVPEQWLAHLAHQLLTALQFLHEHGRTHRDFKPANVMITRQGDAKLCDFGCTGTGLGGEMVGTR